MVGIIEIIMRLEVRRYNISNIIAMSFIRGDKIPRYYYKGSRQIKQSNVEMNYYTCFNDISILVFSIAIFAYLMSGISFQ